ncbi:MAG: nucleotide exchange factor GrpE [Reichenbachiella sp.]
MAKSKTETDKKTKSQDTKSKSTKSGKKVSKKVDKSEGIKAELQESKDKYLRLYSEFENFRRRTAKEKLELIGSANESLIQSLLPIIDDFERAEKSMTEESDVKSVREGVDLIYNKFKSILEQKGVKKIEADKGSEFDLELHEAITQIPAPEEGLQGKIVDVVENGYQLNDKVIRFSKVVTGA